MKKLHLLLLTLQVLLFSGHMERSPKSGQITVGITEGEAASPSVVKTIKIWKMDFNPKTISVEPGTTIRWFNKDSSEHDITSGTAVSGRKARQMKISKFPDGKFQSGLFGEGQTFEIQLTEKGKYTYFCNEHPDMQAMIVVK